MEKVYSEVKRVHEKEEWFDEYARQCTIVRDAWVARDGADRGTRFDLDAEIEKMDNVSFWFLLGVRLAGKITSEEMRTLRIHMLACKD